MIAIVTVLALVFFALGWREALIVAVSIPIIYSLTLMVNYWFGYHHQPGDPVRPDPGARPAGRRPDRRRGEHLPAFQDEEGAAARSVLTAVDEVRPPVILATLAVILSFLPMMFITGMMGPYMRPMAVNVPLTMIMSLVVAFTVTPWMAYHVLKGQYGKGEEEFVLEESRTYRVYRRILEPFIDSRKKGWLLVGGRGGALLRRAADAGAQPGADEDAPLRQQERVSAGARPAGRHDPGSDRRRRARPETIWGGERGHRFRGYVGTASAMDFNGMVRHYYLRQGANVADIRVNLATKERRAQQSHEITLRLRDDLTAIAERHGASLKIVETPPGPPVIATVAAEVYAEPGRFLRRRRSPPAKIGPRAHDSRAAGGRCRRYGGGAADAPAFRPRSGKGGPLRHQRRQIARTLALALGGDAVGTVHLPRERRPLEIVVQPAARNCAPRPTIWAPCACAGADGTLVPLSELGTLRRGDLEPTIYHKNLERVVYVFGEMAGKSPVNAVLNLPSFFKENPAAGRHQGGLERRRGVEHHPRCLPRSGDRLRRRPGADLHPAGHRDRSLAMPLIIMAAIPLTMIGIMPGFWLLNLITDQPVGGYATPVFFTATAMIGMIALAGIVVRNSIILIDFIHHALKRGRLAEGGDHRKRRGAPAADPADRRRGAPRQLDHHPRPDLLRPGLVDHLRRLRLHRLHPGRDPRRLLAHLRQKSRTTRKEFKS